LWVRIKISNTTKGKDIATLIEDEAVNELSVQYKTIGYFIENGIKYLTELKLVELGFVTRAANDKANVLTIERKEEQEPPVFDIAKLSDEDLTEKQKQINEEITKRILEKI
jgi:phage head maturation protease